MINQEPDQESADGMWGGCVRNTAEVPWRAAENRMVQRLAERQPYSPQGRYAEPDFENRIDIPKGVVEAHFH